MEIRHLDDQHPHAEDQVYFVAAGRARFSGADLETTVGSGDIPFIPAKEPHRFHQIAEDLEALVFFSPAEETLKDGS